ncbi:MAG: hypothetical protein R3F20_01365 [Planctomycetota bacterium]
MATGDLPAGPRATARGLLRVLTSGGSLSPDPSRLGVSARIMGDEAWPREPNVYGSRAVTLTNTGPTAIVGGVEVDAPRIALAFRPEDGGPRLTGDDRSWLMAGFLPVTCLEPGESTLVCIPTSTPRSRGRWVPELLLLVGPFDTPATRVLATLPAVEIF